MPRVFIHDARFHRYIHRRPGQSQWVNSSEHRRVSFRERQSLRTNVLDWDEQRLWQTYSTLTDIESVFRSLKGELGLRPVFHQKENRADGHLFITVLAYQCVQVIRKTLKEQGINDSWASLRKTMSVQQRVTTSMQRSDGRMVHVRKSTKAEPTLMRIYQALGINAAPGGTKKLIV